jgi:hypothetical protein
MIPPSGTQSQAEGTLKKLEIQAGREPVSSGSVSVETDMFPVRVRTGDAKVLVRVDIELLRRQQEIEEANEEIRRRLRG